MALTDFATLADPPVVSAAEMADADRAAIETYGIPEAALMETAARQVARVARALLGDIEDKRVVALAGPGHNGGDALAAVRVLCGWGARARAVLVREPGRMRPLARAQAEALVALGITVRRHGEGKGDGADLIVDGLLGSGSGGAMRQEFADAIAPANRSGLPILSIDIPSGQDPDTGEIAGEVAHATCVVSLGAPKRGLFASRERGTPAPDVILADIGIPPAAFGARTGEFQALFARSDLIRIIR